MRPPSCKPTEPAFEKIHHFERGREIGCIAPSRMRVEERHRRVHRLEEVRHRGSRGRETRYVGKVHPPTRAGKTRQRAGAKLEEEFSRPHPIALVTTQAMQQYVRGCEIRQRLGVHRGTDAEQRPQIERRVLDRLQRHARQRSDREQRSQERRGERIVRIARSPRVRLEPGFERITRCCECGRRRRRRRAGTCAARRAHALGFAPPRLCTRKCPSNRC